MTDSLSGFRSVPRTGVIYVMSEAERLGYSASDPAWCNLGQGQPEAGALPGAPPRVDAVAIHPQDHEYAPVAGLWELREAVADLYNHMYRRGLASQYTADNVAICGGGRLALTRAAATLGSVNLGHLLPDYTAYEELLEIFRNVTPIPMMLDPEQGYAFRPEALRREITGRGLGAILLSNPCNPTGKLIRGDELDGWVSTARDLDCSLLVDEFYSHYVWTGEGTVSAAAYVRDVNRDPVVIFNGLTKNWRYPGWRLSWTLGPKSVIEGVASAGSFLDGGGSRPLQRAALPLLAPDLVATEIKALQAVFERKRALLLEGIRKLGITVDHDPDGTFYVWGNLSSLGGKLVDGMDLFKAALTKKTIIVPGEFFDINPGKRRPGRVSRFRNYARFSFGPPQATLETGLQALAQVVAGRG